MKKAIFAVLSIVFVYCISQLLVVHEALIQIEHDKPLQIISQNSANIHTEQKESGFITDIILPSEIFYNHTQFEIKSDVPQNITIKLAGPKVAYKNAYKKYIIKYKQLAINNGKVLSGGRGASFAKPFIHSLDNLTTATVDFDYKTDFVLRNMSLLHFVGSIATFFAVLWYVIRFLYYNKKVQTVLSYCFNTSDFSVLVINGYKNIRKEYKFCFWVNFLVLNILYLYLNMNFLHGDHDWFFLRQDLLNNYTWEGRFSISFINTLLEHKYLPVLNNCLSFIFVALTPIFLLKYWNLTVTKFNLFALSVVLLLHPMLLEVIYLLHLSYSYLLAPLLIVISLILSEKKNYSSFIISILLLIFTFGDYNVCINTLAVIFIGKMLIEYANGNNFLQLLKKYLRTVSVITLSAFIYFLIVQYLKFEGIVNIDHYGVRLLGFDQIFPRIITIFTKSFRHFYIPYSFIDLNYLILLSLLFIPMFIIMITETIKKKNIFYLLGSLFIFIALVFSSKIVYCITESDASLRTYVYYFSLPFVYTCIIAYICNSRMLWSKNLLFLLLIPICYMSIIRDYEYQKFWKIGLDGDKNLASRLADKFESDANYSFDKKYNLIFIGRIVDSFNSAYYLNKDDVLANRVINISFFPDWQINSIGYYTPRTDFKSCSLFKFEREEMVMRGNLKYNNTVEAINSVFSDIPQRCIMNLKPWPHKDSVLVYNDTIVVCWREKELEYIKKVLVEDK